MKMDFKTLYLGDYFLAVQIWFWSKLGKLLAKRIAFEHDPQLLERKDWQALFSDRKVLRGRTINQYRFFQTVLES